MRRFLPYTTAATLAIAFFTAWTFYARYEEGQEAQQRAEEQARSREEASDKQAEEILEGGVKILSYSVEPGVVAAGGRALICYGVANASRVSIEPHVKELKPALTSCLEVFPAKTTTYKITAEDVKGNQTAASLTVSVR